MHLARLHWRLRRILLRRGAFLGMSLDVVIISAIMPLVAWGHIYGGNPRYAEWRLRVRESRGWRRQSWWRWRLRRASVWRSWQSGWREDRYDRDDKRIDDPERGSISGDFGFSLLVDMPRKYLVYAGITGGAGWLAYLVSMQVGTSQVAAAFFSSLAAALLSQVFARVLKAPVTIFLVAGILPTVPGASIYRSVYFLIQGQTKWYNFYLIQTIQIAGAMAVAIFIVDSLFRLLRNKAS